MCGIQRPAESHIVADDRWKRQWEDNRESSRGGTGKHGGKKKYEKRELNENNKTRNKKDGKDNENITDRSGTGKHGPNKNKKYEIRNKEI